MSETPLSAVDSPAFRILVQSVGTGGPNHPVWDGLAHVMLQVRPNLIVWVCSEQTHRETLPKIRRCLEQEGWRPATERAVVVADPDQLEWLYAECTKLIDELRESHPQAAIEVDYTSGTKAMSCAAAMAAVARDVDRVHYAVGPRDVSGRATSTARVVTLALNGPVLDQRLRELGAMFDRGEFAAVRDEVETIKPRCPGGVMHDRLVSLQVLAEAYACWDRFRWKSARGKLQHSYRQPRFQSAGWDCGRLQRQEEFLKRCHEDTRSPQRVADLLANAERLFRRDRFDDAVARCYRLTEYILQIRFGQVFQIEKLNSTTRVEVSSLEQRCPTTVKKLADRGRIDSTVSKISLGLAETLQALAEANDPLGSAGYREYWGEVFSASPGDPRGPLKQKLDIRNNSFLAHGSDPMNPESAEELLTMVRNFAKQHIELEGLDFEELQTTARFIRCPWLQSAAASSE